MWACEIDAFFLFMAYLSFAYLFSFLITIMIEMPCHNMYQTFIMGKSLRSETAANLDQMYQRQQKGSNSSSKRLSSSEDCESDAETLDGTVEEDSGYSINKSSSEKTKKKAAYAQAKKNSGKLVLDEAGDNDNNGDVSG